MSVFKRRRFPVEIILLCVRWYCRYGISYRDLDDGRARRRRRPRDAIPLGPAAARRFLAKALKVMRN